MRGYSSLLRSRRSIFNEWGREEVACDEFIVNVQTIPDYNLPAYE